MTGKEDFHILIANIAQYKPVSPYNRPIFPLYTFPDAKNALFPASAPQTGNDAAHSHSSIIHTGKTSILRCLFWNQAAMPHTAWHNLLHSLYQK